MLTRTLNDADGKPHTYVVYPHPAEEGQEVFWQLVAIASEPGGAFVQKLLDSGDILERVISGIRQALKEEDETDGPADQDLAGLVRGIDFGSLGQDIRRTLASSQMPGLAKDLLRHTVRDGKMLSESVHFNEAYTANWGEYIQALLLAVEVNRFFALLTTFFGAAKAT